MESKKIFTDEPMSEIVYWLKKELKTKSTVRFKALNPDYLYCTYAGTIVSIDDNKYIYRGYKAWTDLCELLFCRMLTPSVINDYLVLISFEKLDITDSFHRSNKLLQEKAVNGVKEERYGVDSKFFEINKCEEPAFFLPYYEALKNVKLQERKRVLDLGVNSADEFQPIKQILQASVEETQIVGVDYSKTAIEYARLNYKEKNFKFFVHDINKLDELNLGKFDLIISIGTLQSPGINFKLLFMSLVQNYLSKQGAIILGFPNCRWMGGEMIYGAKAPNYSYSEMSLLYKDVYFCKKYLQQKKFRVTLTGKDYLFLTATKIGSHVKESSKK